MKSIATQYIDFWKNAIYDFCYIVVDVHNTIFKPTFNKTETYTYFPWAKQCLQEMSINPKIKLILWTGTYPDKIEEYLQHFLDNGIVFDYINENPECTNSTYACFDNKFYFDIGIDDKFGFEANVDWAELYPVIIKTK